LLAVRARNRPVDFGAGAVGDAPDLTIAPGIARICIAVAVIAFHRIEDELAGAATWLVAPRCTQGVRDALVGIFFAVRTDHRKVGEVAGEGRTVNRARAVSEVLARAPGDACVSEQLAVATYRIEDAVAGALF
jgi:hypothetical protein